MPSLPTRPPHMTVRSPGKMVFCSAGSPEIRAGMNPRAVTNTRHFPMYPGWNST